MTNITSPYGAGSAATEKSEATVQGGFLGAEDNGKPDFDEFSEAAQLAHAKRLSSVGAHLALAGFELHRLVSGAYLIAQAGFVRHVTDLSAAEHFSRGVQS